MWSPIKTATLLVLLYAAGAVCLDQHALPPLRTSAGVDAVQLPHPVPAEPPDISVENADTRTRPKAPDDTGGPPIGAASPRRALVQSQAAGRARRVRKLRRTTSTPQEDHPDLLEGAESSAVLVDSSTISTPSALLKSTSETPVENKPTVAQSPNNETASRNNVPSSTQSPTTTSPQASSSSLPSRGRGKFRLTTTTTAASDVEHDDSGAVVMTDSLYNHFRPMERDVPEEHITPFLDFGRKIVRNEEQVRLSTQIPQGASKTNLIETSTGRLRSFLRRVSNPVPTNATEETVKSAEDIVTNPNEDETHEEMDVAFEKQVVERNKVPTRRRDRLYSSSRDNVNPYTTRGTVERTMENLVIPPPSMVNNNSSEMKKGTDIPVMNDRLFNNSKKVTRRKYLVTRKILHGNSTEGNTSVLNVTYLEPVRSVDFVPVSLNVENHAEKHVEDVRVDESTLNSRQILPEDLHTQESPKIAKNTMSASLSSAQSTPIITMLPAKLNSSEDLLTGGVRKTEEVYSSDKTATNVSEPSYVVRRFENASSISSSGSFNKQPKSQIPYSFVVGPRSSASIPSDVEVFEPPGDRPVLTHLPYANTNVTTSDSSEDLSFDTQPTTLPDNSKIIGKAVVTSVSVKESWVPSSTPIMEIVTSPQPVPTLSSPPTENPQDVVKIFFNHTDSPVEEPPVKTVVIRPRNEAPKIGKVPEPLPLSTTEDLENIHNLTHWLVNRTEVSNTSEVSVVTPSRPAPTSTSTPQTISKDQVTPPVPTASPSSTTQSRPHRYRSTTTTSTVSPPLSISVTPRITRYRSTASPTSSTVTARSFLEQISTSTTPSEPSRVESKGRAIWPKSSNSSSNSANSSSTVTSLIRNTSTTPSFTTDMLPMTTIKLSSSTVEPAYTSSSVTPSTPLSSSISPSSTTPTPSAPVPTASPQPRPIPNPPVPISAETIKQRSYKKPNVTIYAVAKEDFKPMPSLSPPRSAETSPDQKVIEVDITGRNNENYTFSPARPNIPKRNIIAVPKGSLGITPDNSRGGSETESPPVVKDPIGPALVNVRTRGRAVSKQDFEGSQDSSAKRVLTERELGVVPSGFGLLTYLLMAIGVVPLALAGVCTARYFINRRKKVLDESDSSSELSCHRRNQMAARADMAATTKLPRPLPHLPPPSPLQQTWECRETRDCRDLKNGDSESRDQRDRERVLQVPPPTRWEFPRDKLRLQTVLGQGNFGQVWKAEADDVRGHHGVTRLVAVKTVKEGASIREREDLLRELEIMQQLGEHSNVVTLLGCCTEKEPFLLIMEYVMYGKLLAFLRDHRTRQDYYNFSEDSDALTSRDLTVFALCVARGMEYIASKGIIHRDLAARNVLVDHTKRCKIADFGMSRSVRDSECGQVYEQRETKGALPIRWMAPESLLYSVFTHKSDVWSFGILLWEIVTLGSTPYPAMGAREVMRSVRDGYRLERPAHCRPELFRIVARCWHADASKRPDFADLRHALFELLEDSVRGGSYVDLEGFAMDSKLNGVGLTPPGCGVGGGGHGMLTRDEVNV